jgi:hydrogenase maturation protein HypF
LQINGNHSFYLLKIKGLVQGVGFRPFIYRLANDYGLKGWVENQNDGVLVKIESSGETAEKFRCSILKEAPLASSIQAIELQKAAEEMLTSFEIRKSESHSNRITEISPDIAVCDHCLQDARLQKHRLHYPFINCTNCGPRFTIIQALPYDRPHTTMDRFVMCDTCKSEYEAMSDRRFHAQPIACNCCGPVYSLYERGESISDFEAILEKTSTGLVNGKLYAIKGLGGFHLMCNALDETAVRRLRSLKTRDGKPFAVMFRSVTAAKEYISVSRDEETMLTSWRRPIVLAKKTKELSPGVADGLSTLGVMLPYMPVHHFLFERIPLMALVFTSGNLAGEPVMISNEEAQETFKNDVDGMITYNRDIYNRADDSVVAVFNKKTHVFRRSRGYTPNPIRTTLPAEGIFAAGAELVNSFCMGKGDQAIMSQYIGDLKNFETYHFYKETYERFSKMLRFKPELVVCDLHPDYLSSRFAEEISEIFSNGRMLRVQHHHAHIASVMADNQLDEPVIGISFDGTGLGSDGNSWGAEVFIADFLSAERQFHFDYIPLPGGDKAVEDPWRMAISYLYHAYGDDMVQLPLPIFREIDPKKIQAIVHLIKSKTNSPVCSSAGRLFDAVAAMIGLLHHSSFHAEAPMRLESIADLSEKRSYAFEIHDGIISFISVIRQIITDVINNEKMGVISGKFHNTVIDVISHTVKDIGNRCGLKKVVLSGGSFQNRILSERSENQLIENGYEVYTPTSVPVNDQGIALGQLMIAAKMRQAGLIQ